MTIIDRTGTYDILNVVGTDISWVEGFAANARAVNPNAHIHTKGSMELCLTRQCVDPIDFFNSVWRDVARWPFRRLWWDQTRDGVEWQDWTVRDRDADWRTLAYLSGDLFWVLNKPEAVSEIWNWIYMIEHNVRRASGL